MFYQFAYILQTLKTGQFGAVQGRILSCVHPAQFIVSPSGEIKLPLPIGLDYGDLVVDYLALKALRIRQKATNWKPDDFFDRVA